MALHDVLVPAWVSDLQRQREANDKTHQIRALEQRCARLVVSYKGLSWWRDFGHELAIAANAVTECLGIAITWADVSEPELPDDHVYRLLEIGVDVRYDRAAQTITVSAGHTVIDRFCLIATASDTVACTTEMGKVLSIEDAVAQILKPRVPM